MKNSTESALRIKLCGITRPEDAALASALGADAIGMIFYSKSPRNVSIEQAREILANISPLCLTVAVVVNPELKMLETLCRTLPINMIQFHGSESPEYCESLGLPYMKAVRMNADTSLTAVRARYASASALLLDTYDKKLAGGTGRTFDWSLLENLDICRAPGPQIVLAGGLLLENISQAVKRTGIRNLDINSGIESAPGIKDHKKMFEIMKMKTRCVL